MINTIAESVHVGLIVGCAVTAAWVPVLVVIAITATVIRWWIKRSNKETP